MKINFKKTNSLKVATTLFLSAAACIFSIPQSANAEETQLSPNQVDGIVSGYGRQIQNDYSGISGRKLNDKQSQLAEKNSEQKSMAPEMGLSLKDTQVSTNIISTSKTAGGYTVVANIDTHLHMVPNSGVTITIAGEHRDQLDSSFTDRHILTLTPDAQQADGYSVVSDEIQNPDEDKDDSLPILSAEPQESPTNDDQNQFSTRGSLDFATNKEGLNYIKMSQYAELWTNDANKNKMNPKYPVYKEQGTQGNCTNFLSQVVHEGGLPTTTGHSWDVGKDNVWTWNLSGIAAASHTWSGAQNSYNYMKDYSHAFTVENNPYHIGEGGLIYADWEGNGNLDHAMVVVGNINGGPHPSPIICQKTVNRYDYPFYKSQATANSAHNGKTIWKGLQFRCNF